MHVPDGFLSPQITVPAYAVSAPLWAWAARRHFGRASTDSLPIIGSLTALAFVIQTIMIPVPGGTSTHLVGVMLLALLYHPLVAFVCESLVLVVQALFFGAGGVPVLAVNALAMGLAGPFAGWLVYHAARRVSEEGALFLAGYPSLQVGAPLLRAAPPARQPQPAPRSSPMPPAVPFPAMLLPSLTVAGLAEAAYTLFALSLLRRAKLALP